MKQESSVRFSSEDKKIHLICDSDVSLGSLHDFVMHLKGIVIDRMIEAQKSEMAAMENKEETNKESEQS
jgi:hypothetical protein